MAEIPSPGLPIIVEGGYCHDDWYDFFLGLMTSADEKTPRQPQRPPAQQRQSAPKATQRPPEPVKNGASERMARQALTLLDAIDRLLGGVALPWTLPIADIPEGWQLCDGTNGTKDLRDRFILGAGSTYPFNTTGGGEIEATMGPPDNTTDVNNGSGETVASSGHEHTITVDPNLPPYYTLYFIQKVS